MESICSISFLQKEVFSAHSRKKNEQKFLYKEKTLCDPWSTLLLFDFLSFHFQFFFFAFFKVITCKKFTTYAKKLYIIQNRLYHFEITWPHYVLLLSLFLELFSCSMLIYHAVALYCIYVHKFTYAHCNSPCSLIYITVWCQIRLSILLFQLWWRI